MPAISRQSVLDSALSGGGTMDSLIRSMDWSKTPLGAVETWPQSLKTSVSICLNSRFPVLIWWGPGLVKIYNDAYAQIIGSKHPGALGSQGRAVWPEIWDTIGPLLTSVMAGGEANYAEDLQLLLERHGYLEEGYFTFSYSPIRDESGGIGGVFTPVVESTEKVIGERRLRTLRDLATARSNRSRDAEQACQLAVRWLAANPPDVPFAAIYLFDENCTVATLAAASASNFGFPQTLDLQSGGWLSVEHILSSRISTVSVADLGLASQPLSPWNSRVEEAAVVPIVSGYGAGTVGLLLAGISPQKRLDERYHAFFLQIAEQLSESIREARVGEREMRLLAEREAERAKIRGLFQQAPAAILMLEGPEHKVTLVNARYVALVGRTSAADLMGKAIAQGLPEIVAQGFVDLLDKVYRTGEPFVGNEVPARLGPKDASELAETYFNFAYQPTRDASGKVDGILVHAVEVTEQVLARHEIESREEQFRVLADSMPQMAWMANPDGNLFWYNRRWYEYTGTTFEQMQGWGWQAVHDQDVLPAVIDRYQQSLTTGEPFSMTFPLRGADGKFRDFLTLAQPVRDSTGRIMRWFGTNTDMEAQKKTEDALRQSEKLAAVGRLASSIAHEINNPLEAVTNLLYLVKGSGVNLEAGAYLDLAEAELGRVAQIVSQTLRFHKQPSSPTPSDVPELLNSVLALYRSKLSRKEFQLQVEAAACPPLVCYAGEVRQVLANLIGNALDAMQRGGTLRLRVRAATNWHSGRSGIRVTVADSGQGMSPQTMKRLYEPFFTTKGSIGTGLGLWVSAGIVQKHDGSLRAHSSQKPGDTGTVFELFIPHGGLLEKSLGTAP